MDKRQAILLVRQYKLLLMKHIQIEKVYLYGSYANGTNTIYSDIDVAIIANNLSPDYFAETPLVWKLRREVDDRIEPIIIDPKNDNAGFLEEISRNGIEID